MATVEIKKGDIYEKKGVFYTCLDFVEEMGFVLILNMVTNKIEMPATSSFKTHWTNYDDSKKKD